ncbi:MAG: pilus biosynthesis protein TapB [Candidatus Hinthialibacteria bacterium]|nr:type II/IV secretion system protein [bacterium]MBV6483269.1 Type II secretion system protein E [bacterium]MCC6733732.1 type II/IV secretion system protein [Candidatus Omnitrophota bacterium]MCE7906834.1 type II/IV secretion system protein [Candidatus Omnitrophica bacterium COP1]
MAETPVLGRSYGELLVTLGVMTEDDLNRALAIQSNQGGDLDAILVENSIVDIQKLHDAICDYLGIETVEIKDISIQRDILQLVPVRLVHRYHLVPVERENGCIKVATADPLNHDAFDDLKLLLRCEVEPLLAYSSDIKTAIKRYYGIGSDTVDSLMEEEGDEFATDVSAATDGDIEELSEDASIIRFVNQVMSEAINDRATDIHIEPFDNRLRIRYRIDGLLYEASLPPAVRRYQAAIISRIKIMADMNIAEKRLPQDGRITIRRGGTEFDLRVSTVPTPYGESIVIRILNSSGELYDLGRLGMDPGSYEIWQKMIHRSHGIILVTGPTGSGKTTTLYASLAELNRTDVKIITIEEPIEYQMEGITQIQVQPKIGLSFATVLRSLLRQDPDIMLVGETRDQETAEITIRTALTGHLVFSTLHTNDAAGAIPRLVDMGVEPFLVASSLIGVIAQRLVRVICPNCKDEVAPQHELLAALGYRPDDYTGVSFFKGRGCEECKYLGYSGRTGIYEMMPIGQELRDLTTRRASGAEIKRCAMQQGMETLRQYGWGRVKSGLTTVEELLRVTQEDVYLEKSITEELNKENKVIEAGFEL